MAYTPPSEILEKYANLLVNFALGGGKGVKSGEVVWVRIPESAKLLYVPLRNTILKAGAIPLMQYTADEVSMRDEYELASDEQLSFFPDKYYRGLIDQIDHLLGIISEVDKYELQSVDPRKILQRSNAMFPFMKWRHAKEAAGKFTWTLAMFGTTHMAQDVGMSEEEYWEEIIKACYLDAADPVAEWQRISAEVDRIKEELNKLPIDYLQVKGEEIDITIGIGKNRQWCGGGGRNIPSFEIFISPDWRRTSGVIKFNHPLYHYGSVIRDISLRFEKGLVVEATASEGETLLKEMIASENANKIGEYSLTDGRHSRITKAMGEILYDENMGGEQGNTHMALGNAYRDSYPGDPNAIPEELWDEWGYNESPVHTDIISTTKRTVTAYLEDGSTRVIYDNGRFTL